MHAETVSMNTRCSVRRLAKVPAGLLGGIETGKRQEFRFRRVKVPGPVFILHCQKDPVALLFSGSAKREEQFFTAAAVVADSAQDNRENFFGEVLGGFPAASDQMFRGHAGDGFVKALLLGD